MKKKEIELFVPGRLCLFGEHSDWAGEFRRKNSKIERGYTIVTPTNQGTHAKVRKRDDRRIAVNANLENKLFFFSADLKLDILKTEAKKDSLFNYMAGVTYYIVERYHNGHIGGIDIESNTTLPVKKGLSSSASICVLTARAFNLLYNLKISHRGEMDLAYKGENLTESRCGRMDQGCAYKSPLRMTFDEDGMDLREMNVGKEINMVVVDLKRGKNTKKILTDLNKSYPFAQNAIDRKVQKYLGIINKEIILAAEEAIASGDIMGIGYLMNKAQRKFDKYLGPVCDELKAPKLHYLLKYAPIRQFIYGGKGVGSQGDGCAQFVCRGKEEQQKMMDILDNDKKLDVKCYELDIKKT